MIENGKKVDTIRTAICSVLAVGALTCASAMAHDVTSLTQGSEATNATRSESSSMDSSTDRTGANSSATSAADSSQASSTGYTDGTSGQTADADQANRQNPAGDKNQRDGAVVWYVLPVTLQSQSDVMSKGCWVRMYSGDEFEGRVLSIVGPAYMHEMQSPYGTGMNNWESAVVGPNATVTTYDNENFKSRNAVLRANQRYPDLDDSKLGLFDDIESMKVECKQSS